MMVIMTVLEMIVMTTVQGFTTHWHTLAITISNPKLMIHLMRVNMI